jgi:hypothetical protein
MKKIVLSLLVLSCFIVGAQTTSQNWTHADCISGNSYTLFNLLDSNQVVVMEFEMGCSSCAVAAQDLDTMPQHFSSSNPGQVKFFVMDYINSHTCTSMQNFVANNSLTCAGFVGCLADKNYYTTSSPMPMIVVTGGPSHTVYYKKSSYTASDLPAIKAAITQALSDIASGISNQIKVPLSVSIASNPAINEVYLNITSNGNLSLDIEVFNLLGENVSAQKIELKDKGYTQVRLAIPELISGVYFVRYKTGQQSKTLKFISGK